MRALLLGLCALLLLACGCGAQDAAVEANLLSLVAMPGVGLGAGWRYAGYGCTDCTFRDTLRRRNGSTSSVFAQVVPWGNWQLAADLPFSGMSVFDAFVKGSVLTNGAIYLEDTINRRQSKWLSLDTAARGDARVLAGPTDDGWYHIQVNFVKLGDSSSTKLGALPSMWNKICILDKSGTGYTLQLDTAYLYSSDSFSFQTASAEPGTPFPCVGARCDERPATPAPPAKLVPLLHSGGGEFEVQGAEEVDASTGFILRLKPEVTNEQLAQLCAELETTNSTSRFNGLCLKSENVAGVQALEAPEAPVSFPFQTVAVESAADLLAMRRTLGDVLQYIEKDGSARVDNIPDLTIELPPDMATIDAAAPWGLDRIDQAALPLDGAYSPGQLDGSGVHVYVLDTGLRTTHTEFTERVGEYVSFTSGYAVQGVAEGAAAASNGSDVAGATEAGVAAAENADCSPDELDCVRASIGGLGEATVDSVAVWDGHGHGTHVAGTVCGSTYGVAKKAIIHSVQTMGADGSGSYSSIIAGMNWVVQHVRKNGWRGVVNMSLGGPASTALNDAAQQLIAAGIPVVTSAGNKYGADACTQSPASNPQAIAVASSDQRDALSTFSNVGSCVDIVAPGSTISSAGIQSDTATTVMSGTSMASPHTAGVVALILQAYPTASVAEVSRLLIAGTQNINFRTGTAPRFLQAQQSRIAPTWRPATASPAPASPSPSPSPLPAPTSSKTFLGMPKLAVGYS